MHIKLHLDKPLPKDLPKPPPEWLAKNVFAPFIKHLIEKDKKRH